MKIETKYDIGDTVYRMEDNKVKELIISSVNVRVELNTYQSEEININYGFEKEVIAYNEKNIFKTKQDLLNSL